MDGGTLGTEQTICVDLSQQMQLEEEAAPENIEESVSYMCGVCNELFDDSQKVTFKSCLKWERFGCSSTMAIISHSVKNCP